MPNQKLYVLVLPRECHSLKPPHSLSCLKTVWRGVQCTDEGRFAPSRLNNTELSYFNTLTMT